MKKKSKRWANEGEWKSVQHATEQNAKNTKRNETEIQWKETEMLSVHFSRQHKVKFTDCLLLLLLCAPFDVCSNVRSRAVFAWLFFSLFCFYCPNIFFSTSSSEEEKCHDERRKTIIFVFIEQWINYRQKISHQLIEITRSFLVCFGIDQNRKEQAKIGFAFSLSSFVHFFFFLCLFYYFVFV